MTGCCGVRLRSARVAVWVVLCAAGYPVISFAQQAAEKAHAAMPVDDRRLVLDLVVHDHAGNLVPGLQEQDFVVLDNQRPQKVLSLWRGQTTTDNFQARSLIRRSCCW